MSMEKDSLLKFRIHAVTDTRVLADPDFFRKADEVAGTGAAAFHLRGHDLTGREFYDIALKLRALTRKAGVPLIVNDRLDVALAVDADFLHLGQRSIPLASAAQLCRGRGLGFGFSCHSPQEAQAAAAEGAAYLYLGTIFPSASKPGAQTAGLELVEKVSRAVACPVFAIGGLNPETARGAAAAGAFGCAAISAVWSSDRPGEAVRRMLAALDNSSALLLD
jgi:thiamine-phosphate pyrophosphorylase